MTLLYLRVDICSLCWHDGTPYRLLSHPYRAFMIKLNFMNIDWINKILVIQEVWLISNCRTICLKVSSTATMHLTFLGISKSYVLKVTQDMPIVLSAKTAMWFVKIRKTVLSTPTIKNAKTSREFLCLIVAFKIRLDRQKSSIASQNYLNKWLITFRNYNNQSNKNFLSLDSIKQMLKSFIKSENMRPKNLH